MPLLEKYQKIKEAMIAEYGPEKGEKVFYAYCNEHGINPDAKSIFDIKGAPQHFHISQFSPSQVETKEGMKYYVTGYISTSDLDLTNDIVTPECLKDMVSQIESGNIKIDVEHEAYTKDTTIIPMGKIVKATLDNKGILIEAELNSDNSRFKEVWASIKNGFLDAFSITFLPLQFVEKEVAGVKARLLYAIKLLNVAITGCPAQEKATITGAFMKSLSFNNPIGEQKMADKTKEELDKEKLEEEEAKKKKSVSEEVPKVEVVEQKALKTIEESLTALSAQVVGLKSAVEEMQKAKEVQVKSALDAEKISVEMKAIALQVAEIKEALKAPVHKAIAGSDGTPTGAIAQGQAGSIIGLL